MIINKFGRLLFLSVIFLFSCELATEASIGTKQEEAEKVAPPDMRATTDRIDSIKLSWNGTSRDLKIFRSESVDSGYILITTITNSQNTYIDDNLDPNSTYYYYSLYDYNGKEGPKSSTIKGVSHFETQDFTCVEGFAELTFSWENRIGIDYYRLYGATTSSPGNNLLVDNIIGNTVSFVPEDSKRQYYYLIAVANDIEGVATELASYQLVDLPAPGNGVSQTTLIDITISWDQVPGADYYTISYYEDNSTYDSVILESKFTETEFTHSTPYYYGINNYVVRPYRNDGTYGERLYITASMPNVFTSNIKAEYLNRNQLKLTWDLVPGVTKYYIYRGTTWGFNHVDTVKIGEVDLLNFIVDDISALPRGHYRYWVGSYLAPGVIKRPDSISYNLVKPPVITEVSLYRLSDPSTKLTTSYPFIKYTSDKTDFEDINLYRATTESGPYELVGGGGTKFDEDVPSPGTYYYKASISGSFGESPLSEAAMYTYTDPVSYHYANRYTKNEVTLHWFDTRFSRSFEVWYSTTRDGTYTRLASDIRDITYAHSNILVDDIYYYKVRGIDRYGNPLGFSNPIKGPSYY